MRRRVLGLAVATVLAILGTLLIVRYVEEAGDRESAGQELSDVLVAATFIPAGTPADQLAEAVVIEAVPSRLVVDGAVTSLDQLSGLVATSDLNVREQLTVGRFGTPEEAAVAISGRVPVPEGLIELSVNVSPEQSVGGVVGVGETISILAAFDEGEQPTNTVGVLLRNVLVTSVQGGVAPAQPAEGTEIAATEPEPLPTTNTLVTVAVDGPDAEKLVYAIQYGRIYLAREPIDEAEVASQLATAENVFGG